MNGYTVMYGTIFKFDYTTCQMLIIMIKLIEHARWSIFQQEYSWMMVKKDFSIHLPSLFLVMIYLAFVSKIITNDIGLL